MEKDGVYRPDRTIRDVYEDGVEAHQYDELGLSPYARIGSLASDISTLEKPFKRWPKPNVNYHAFTYVGPLVGDTLSPADRITLKPSTSNKPNLMLAAKRLPSLFIAALTYINKTKQLGEEALIASEKAVESDKYLNLSNTIPVFVSFIAVLLLVYAAVVSPQNSIPNPNGGGGQSFGGSSFNSPNIIDNRALFPLSFFPGGNNNNDNNSYGTVKSTPATQYQYVSPTNGQTSVPLTTTGTSTNIGGGSATNVQAPASTSLQQPTSTQLTQPVYDSSSSSSTVPVQTGGSNTSVGGSPSTGSLTPSSGSGSGSSVSVPGLTSPTSVITPSTSVTSPLNNKPVGSSSQTTITLN